MLHGYSDFVELIKEGSSSNPTSIYWKSQLKNILQFEWKKFKTKRYTDYYEIIFEAGDGLYDHYEFLIDKNENLLVEDNIDEQSVKNKIKSDFWKNAQENVEDLKYEPKFLGDLDPIRNASKYNM